MLEILIKKRFCSECGRQLIIGEEFTGVYDTETGEKKTRIYQACPKYFGFHGLFGSLWHDYDSDFDILAKKK